jgi:radical SAM-linked protein
MMKIRVKFKKDQEVRFISHLNLAKTLKQAVSRAGLPIAYSHGFNPHQKISLCHPLPLGMTSESEFADLVLTEKIGTDEVKKRLNEKLPRGIEILEAKEVPLRSKPLAALTDAASYEIMLGDVHLPVKSETLNSAIGTVSYKNSPEPILNITVKIPGMRIKDVLSSLLELDEQRVKLLEVNRTGLFARRGESLISLMDIY